MSKISKKEYDKACAKYKPNKFIIWVYKNFSGLLMSKPKPIGSWLCLISFFIASIGMIYFDQHNDKEMANKFLFFYIPFVLWFPISLTAFSMNNKRNRKIANELGISEDEFNELVIKYE